MFWEKKQIHVKFGNNGRPVVSKLLEPFGLLWGTSQAEINSIDTYCAFINMSKFRVFDDFCCTFGLRVYDGFLRAG